MISLTIERTSAPPAATGGQPPQLLHEFFELQVRTNPSWPALECDKEIVTYAQLDRLSNRVAHLLRARGVGPGVLVAICMKKSCYLFAAMLGVLKAGGAYVPIDPQCPRDRARNIIIDARARILICDDGSEAAELGDSTSVLALTSNEIRRFSRQPLNTAAMGIAPSDACYVIYTSGSTGKPKGVIVEHRNAVNFVRAMGPLYTVRRQDRVYQGFSVAFDASVEEIWAALAFGGTLVVPPYDVGRSPIDAGRFITKQKITFFSTVPTFLALMEHELPTVRVLIVGGEHCASELVERWAPGRRMLNTYGPTETTVVATASVCVQGQPVTIGRPLPGCTAQVLNDRMKPVSRDEIGELYIGGCGVARGYVNLPEMTSERFISNPHGEFSQGDARLFRTHDLVRVIDDGSLQYVGRNDQMVKIRGFRVELSEIEALLLEDHAVRGAGVKAIEHGNILELAAYVVPKTELEAGDRHRIGTLLHERLPDYMIPRYLDAVADLPTMTSGKVDRNSLPPPKLLLGDERREKIPPNTGMERIITGVFEQCFGVSPIFASDDFFRDLGGHSHLAARVISELRAKLNTTRICVRDLYTHRNANHLASYLESQHGPEFRVSDDDKELPVENDGAVGLVVRCACAFGQLLALIGIHAIVAAPILYLLLLALDTINGRLELWRAATEATTFALFVWPTWLVISIAAKWLIIGRFKPGRYPLWGFYYLRWWIVSRFQGISWCGMFVGTPLMSVYYRAMGASVGSNCTLSTPFCTAFDLISIGDNTSVGADTHILGCRVEAGHLVLERVEIGSGCFVGVHCNLGLNVVMNDGACLDDMSMLPDGSVMQPRECRRGSPAIPATVKLPPVVARPTPRWSVLFGAIHLALIYVMGYLLLLGLVPGLALISYSFVKFGPAAAVAATFIAVPLFGAWWLAIVLFIKHFVIGQIRPGLYPVKSSTYVRMWFLRYLLDNTRHLLTPIYATMLAPKFMRLLGAKVGRGVEISTIMHAVPDLLELGEGSFLADACIVGGLRIHRGWVELLQTKIGTRAFVGNSALTPSGVEVGNNSLIGVLSTPPANEHRSPDGSRWLGSPSFELPNATAAESDVQADESRTYRPPARLILLRALMEAMRMLLPAGIIAAHIISFVFVIDISYHLLPLAWIYCVAPLLTCLMSGTTVASSALVKWALMGKFRPTIQPLWCGYVWRNEVVNSVFETVAANAISLWLGSPFASALLRLMGCKIGRWVYLQTTLFSEFDLVKIGDYAALNLGTTIQTHLFEDRVMKADALEIGDRCSIGNMSVILYGVKMHAGSSVGPLSLVMKGEALPVGTRWHGIPIEQVRPQSGSSLALQKSRVA